MFYPDEKLALVIDGVNVYGTSKSLGFDVDYRKLLAFLRGKGKLMHAAYFTTTLEAVETSTLKPLLDWLSYNGYRVHTKPAREFIDASGNRRIRGSMNVEITVDMIARADRIDHFILFSGDGDLAPMIAACQAKGARVTVCSSLKSTPSMVSDDLRRQADHFLDLADLEDQIGKTS